jgi:hypothetical protein
MSCVQPVKAGTTKAANKNKDARIESFRLAPQMDHPATNAGKQGAFHGVSQKAFTVSGLIGRSAEI